MTNHSRGRSYELLEQQVGAFNQHVTEHVYPLFQELSEAIAWYVEQITEVVEAGHVLDRGIIEELQECVVRSIVEEVKSQIDSKKIPELIPGGENFVLNALFALRNHRIKGSLGPVMDDVSCWDEKKPRQHTPHLSLPDDFTCSVEDLRYERNSFGACIVRAAVSTKYDLEGSKIDILYDMAQLRWGGDMEQLIYVESHPILLTECVIEILNNAIRATSGEGVIRIDTWKNGEEVVLTVEDDGEGIPAEVLPRIFEPQFTTRSEMGGTGLGLSLAKDYIEGLLGGSIKVQSELGKGTKVTIRLKVA